MSGQWSRSGSTRLPLSSGSGSPRPRIGPRRSSKPCGSCAGARAGAGARRVLRRAVHGRRLPRRGQGRVATSSARRRSCTASPPTWHALMERLTEQFSRYVAAHAAAGADAIQLFDSWVGVLSVSRLQGVRRSLLGARARSCRRPDDPLRHRRDDAACSPRWPSAGGSAVGIDWRIRLDDAWTAVGEERAIQGNLEPAVLLGPWERAEWAAFDVLRRAGGSPGPRLQSRARRPAPDRSGCAHATHGARPEQRRVAVA